MLFNIFMNFIFTFLDAEIFNTLNLEINFRLCYLSYYSTLKIIFLSRTLHFDIKTARAHIFMFQSK